MIRCSSCQKENADEAKHCGFCGALLQAPQPKRTMFGMPALPPAELERLRALQAGQRDEAPSQSEAKAVEKEIKSDKIKTEKQEVKPPGALDDLLGGMALDLPDSEGWGEGLDLNLLGAAPEIAFADTVDKKLDELQRAAAEAGTSLPAPPPRLPAEPPKRTMLGMTLDQEKLREISGQAAPAPAPALEPPAAAPRLLSEPELHLVPEPVSESGPAHPIRETRPAGHEPPDWSILGQSEPVSESEPVQLGYAEETAQHAPPDMIPMPPLQQRPHAQTTPMLAPEAVLPRDSAPAPRPRPQRPTSAPAPDLDSGGGGGKGILIAIVVVAVLGLLGAAAAFFFLFSGKGESPEVDSSVSPEATEVRVHVPESFGDAVITFGTQRQEVAAGGDATFRLENSALQVGVNDLPVEVAPLDGGDPTRLGWSIFLPARVEHDLSPFDAGARTYRLRLAVPADARLTVQGRDVEDAPTRRDGVDHYRVDVDTDDAWRSAVAAESPEVRHRVFYTVRFQERGQERTAQGDYYVTLRFPRCPLVLSAPPPGWITDRDAATLSGFSRAGGQLRVTNASAQAAVGDDGRFALQTPLERAGAHTLHVTAQAEGCLPERASRTVRRVEPDALRALQREARRLTEGFASVHRAALVNHRGDPLPPRTPVQIRGRLQGFLTEDARTILLLDACARPACYIGLQTTAEIPADIGQEVVAVGYADGTREVVEPQRDARRTIALVRSEAFYTL